MTGKEIVEKFPLSTEVIREWAIKKMIDSFTGKVESEEFEKFLQDRGVHLSQIVDILNTNPRVFFDIFDERKIYINVIRVFDIFQASVFESDKLGEFKTRKEAELKAILLAFSILEEDLVLEKEKLKTNDVDYLDSQE